MGALEILEWFPGVNYSEPFLWRVMFRIILLRDLRASVRFEEEGILHIHTFAAAPDV